MPTVTMSMEEYLALVQGVAMLTDAEMPNADLATMAVERKSKSRTSKYGRTYKREFRRIAPSFKTKSGQWKKNGFRSAVRAAHRATRKILG